MVRPTLLCRSLVLAGLILAIMGFRFLPYALSSTDPLLPWLWGMTPLWAVMLFGVATFRPLWLGWAVPLAAMVLSDVVLHVTGLAPVTLAGRLVLYSIMLAIGGLGLVVRYWRRAPVVAGASVASSLLFFLVTNFLVWLRAPAEASSAIVYEPNLAGLIFCYEMALPFLRNDLLGTGLFSFVLFGGFALLEKGLPVLRVPTAAEAA
ncbi:MAG TPA: hypothetical protein PKD86_09060 [Gemmatales bacterium]|nr:hypothetical protein [Gemmatales bacterium]HMP59487.1 hypothetical protein [Gemmatales bacterium]